MKAKLSLLIFLLLAGTAQDSGHGVADAGVAEVPDVGRLVGVGGGVLDQGPAGLFGVDDGGGTTVTVAVAPNPDGSQTGTVAGATTATETTPAGSVTLQTPAGLQVTGPAGWTGDITLPTVTVTTVAPVAASGNNASAVS